MASPQEFIHKLEVGGGMRHFRTGLAVLVLVLLTFGYNWRAFKNMSTQEAMDTAQLGRNLAEGKGYTTDFIRPFSMYLLKKHNVQKQGPAALRKPGELTQIKDLHPDLANPPVYPVFLAGLMKVLPFEFTIGTKPFWTVDGVFLRYQPDFLISLINQALFLAVVAVVFFLARRLFDPAVARLAALLLLGTELFWRFAVSGLSTMLLLLIFMGLLWCMMLLEQEGRDPEPGPMMRPIVLAVLSGVILALGGLTRYSFAWLLIPVLIFVVLFAGRRRLVLAVIVLVVFVSLMTPWVVRNYKVSGTPFGTAGYALLETTVLFPQHRLERSLQPELRRVNLMAFWHKLMVNSRQIVQNDLPRLGGSWLTALFLAGLLVRFQNPAAARLRYFLLLCLGVLVVVQALGKTQLSEDSPEINSENLLVLLAPLAFIYGVSLFYALLEQLDLPVRELRYAAIAIFSVAACLPMLFVFLPPRTSPLAYPPYHPPTLQLIAGGTTKKELTMSDIPWAIAWYGQRQCIWWTLRPFPDSRDPYTEEDFIAISDYQKPISLLCLSPQAQDGRFYTQWVGPRATERGWGAFILEALLRTESPKGFPLSKPKYLVAPEHLVLADGERWPKP